MKKKPDQKPAPLTNTVNAKVILSNHDYKKKK